MCYSPPSPPTPPPPTQPPSKSKPSTLKPAPSPGHAPAPAPKPAPAPGHVAQEESNPEWNRVDKREQNMASGTAGEGEGYYGTWLSNDRRRRPTEEEQSNLGQSQGNLGFGTVLRKFLGG